MSKFFIGPIDFWDACSKPKLISEKKLVNTNLWPPGKAIKKVKYKQGEPTVQHGVAWMQKMIEQFGNKSFRHYQMASANAKKRGRPPGSKNKKPGEVKVQKPQDFSLYNLKKQEIELKHLEIVCSLFD